MKIDQPRLDQRGRAALQGVNAILSELFALSPEIDSEIEHRFGNGDSLPENLDERAKTIESEMLGNRAFRVKQLVGDWHGRNHGPIAMEAFEEISDRLLPELERAEHGPATLELNADLTPPEYWRDVAFHRTGSWEGHPFMGFVHGELVHKEMVAKFAPGGIFKQRRETAALAPRDDYQDILEMGTSSGHYTAALVETYPEASITGIDLSARMLEHAWRIANVNGWPLKLLQRAAEDSGFEDESFDLVTSYIVLHEMPADAVRAMFAEAFRVLRPGGDLLMGDVTRFADLGPIDVWQADRAARLGGEPHWRESAQLDLSEIAREAGFVEVTSEGIFPHVVIGRKPSP